MQLPAESAVMILPNATLFPQAMLPLYIFEPRYRQMLADALESHRMFTVALQRPDRLRESPVAVAGIGLIRASARNKDGTSQLILQGIARVRLQELVQSKPYRLHRIEVLPDLPADPVGVEPLAAQVRRQARRLLEQTLRQQRPGQGKGTAAKAPVTPPEDESCQRFLAQMAEVEDAGALADLVTCALLRNPVERQVVLETPDIEARLRHVAHFLLAEIGTTPDTDAP